jgi:hypothetical protein
MDGESKVDAREHAGTDWYGETLLYDFAKFLTTLSLLVLGGMLTLSSAARAGDLKLFNIVFVSVAVALAGVCAFSTANSLVDARSKARQPSGHLPAVIKAATALIGLGVGGFLIMWLDTFS